MSKTLQLVSIQHELGMAIGLDLRLEPMLRQFTKVCIRRLGLSSVDFYVSRAISDKAVFLHGQPHEDFLHLLSIPSVEDPSLLPKTPSFDNRFFYKASRCLEIYNNDKDEYIYYFNLSNFGFVALHKVSKSIENNIIELLKPIFQRLSISCQASAEHEQLLNAIHARDVAEKTIKFQLFHDELTQLANRRMLMESLEREVSRALRYNLLGAVLFIDLNRFKAINDALGHAVGDLLLIAVAEIFEGLVRKEDVVARLSGDEFIILLTHINDSEGGEVETVNVVLKKIHDVFLIPIKAGEHRLNITPSIGVDIYPKHNIDPDKILRNADVAMYHAKKKGPNTALFYDEGMSSILDKRLEIEKNLHLAIKDFKQFTVFYQLQYNHLGHCIGAEALLRWDSPKLGVVSPEHFIPIAENTGIMLMLGQWILEEVCFKLGVLKKSGMPDYFKNISVNVSAIQFNQKDFVENLLKTLKNANIESSLLGVELTESALIDNIDEAVEKMYELGTHNIHLSVDDFGTGYSSLSYLSRFPVDTLKIDQVFVRNIDKDANNLAIVEIIMALGKSLHLSVIAEGVETLGEQACLKSLGCEYYQGYYLGRPMSFHQLQVFLSQLP